MEQIDFCARFGAMSFLLEQGCSLLFVIVIVLIVRVKKQGNIDQTISVVWNGERLPPMFAFGYLCKKALLQAGFSE